MTVDEMFAEYERTVMLSNASPEARAALKNAFFSGAGAMRLAHRFASVDETTTSLNARLWSYDDEIERFLAVEDLRVKGLARG